MLTLLKSILLPCLLLANVSFANWAVAQPANIQLEYEITRNGKSFGTVKESFIREDGKYRILSTTKGKGLYALLGKRVLTSDGRVTSKGLVPSAFQLKRGDSKRKSLSASFDWAGNLLRMLVRGETRTAELMPGTQDLASYAYQFMFNPPKGDAVKVFLTTGKKLKQYTYNIKSRDIALNAAGETYKVVHLVNAEVDGKKKKELWLAESKYYIPVKYLVIDKHGDKLEQNLTKISIK